MKLLPVGLRKVLKCQAKDLRQRWAMRAWSRLLHKHGISADKPALLHVGCGPINAHGFINIDARPQPHVHIVTRNLFKLWMIPDASADLIYMCHVLEHVGHNDSMSTLREMYRILRPGGVLRISVPDLDLLIAAYQGSGHQIRAIERALMGGQDYRFNFHYAAFNAEHLRNLLLTGGFRTTREWNPLDCEHHDFADWASRPISWNGRDFPVSLNLEGVK